MMHYKIELLVLFAFFIGFGVGKGGLKDVKPEKKAEDLVGLDINNVSEQELDNLLKDKSLTKINPKAELKKPASKKSKYEDKYKEHVDSLSKEGLDVEGLKLDDEGRLNAELEEFETENNKGKKGKGNKDVKKKEEEDNTPIITQNFSFIKGSDLVKLLETFKQPMFMEMLPDEAKLLINSIDSKEKPGPEFNNTNSKFNQNIESMLKNTPNSQVFIDPDGKVGRKGMLTFIEPSEGKKSLKFDHFVWTIVNSKVLCFYHSKDYLNIIKLFRRSELVITDVVSTPCFSIMSDLDSSSRRYLVCAASIDEKGVWLKSLVRDEEAKETDR